MISTDWYSSYVYIYTYNTMYVWSASNSPRIYEGLLSVIFTCDDFWKLVISLAIYSVYDMYMFI